MKLTTFLGIVCLSLIPSTGFSKDHPRTHSAGIATAGPGTGAKSTSERVSGYTRQDGKHVDSYRKSTPDKNFNNNWSTKGNQNPVTGKDGTKLNPPKKKQ